MFKLSKRVQLMGACGMLLMIAPLPLSAQDTPVEPASEARWTINVAKVKPGMLAAARRYFEAAWLPARREALRRGQIKSFRLLVASSETENQPEFVLVTEYGDNESYAQREARFAEIFEQLAIPDAIMVEGKGRADIFASVNGIEDYREVE